MTAYRRSQRSADHASQSAVIHSGKKMDGRNRWSVHLLRSRSRHNGIERRGLTLFLSAGRMRGEIGTR
jgi:hypothetical protein